MPTPENVALALNDIGSLVHTFAPDGWGFCLCYFSFGDDKQSLYVADSDRKGVVAALRQLADRLEKGQDGFSDSKVGN